MCSERYFLSYAFVTYDSSEDASDATEKMNGITIFGQQIKVNVARPKEGGGGGGFGGDRRGGYNGGGDMPPSAEDVEGAEDLLRPSSRLLCCPVLACSYLDHHPRIWSLAVSLDVCATPLGAFPGHL